MNKKAQDPLVARPASRPTFASLMGYKRSLVDTCKSSNVLVSFHVFVVLLAISVGLKYQSLHIMTHNHVVKRAVKWACP